MEFIQFKLKMSYNIKCIVLFFFFCTMLVWTNGILGKQFGQGKQFDRFSNLFRPGYFMTFLGYK